MAIAKTIQSLIPPAKYVSARNLDHEPVLGANPNKETLPYTVNDLLVQKALSSSYVHLLAYPGSLNGADDYVHYTARDLDRFADEAAKAYIAMGVPVKVRSFYCFSVSMLTNMFRRTIRTVRSSRYWHRLIWIMLQPYLLCPDSDTLFYSYRIAFLQWHIYLFCKVHNAIGL